MATLHESLIDRVLSRHRERPLARRAEIRRVLDRRRGSKTVVALSVRPRPATVQAVSQWLTGRTISRPIWEAAHAIAEELLEKERACGSHRERTIRTPSMNGGLE